MDGCVGAARLMKSFPEGTIPCTKTLYNMLWANKLPLSLFDLPCALGRKKHRKWNRKNKRMLERSIEDRPAIAAAGTEIGHWEIERYSDEDVPSIADELNQRPRRILGYHTPAELFDHFLDEVYAIDKCS